MIFRPFDFTNGPRNARVMIVAESWGAVEAQKLEPLVGRSGMELNMLLGEVAQILHKSGRGAIAEYFTRQNILCANVVNAQPPRDEMWEFFIPTVEARKARLEPFLGLYPKKIVLDGLVKLYKLIEIVKPELIIAFGNYALWALGDNCVKIGNSTDKRPGVVHQSRKIPTGITYWRGSQLYTRSAIGHFKLMPTYHPAAYLRNWKWRYDVLHDISARAPKAFMPTRYPALQATNWDEPRKEIQSAPGFFDVNLFLDQLLKAAEGNFVPSKVPTVIGEYRQRVDGILEIAVDIETRHKHTACMAIATSPRHAICIPFMRGTGAYWTEEEEVFICKKLRKLLTHPNIGVIGHNYLYDSQYLFQKLLFRPQAKYVFDTMLAQHLCWPGQPMSLSYCASMYNEFHSYWKNEGKLGEDKEWDKDVPEDQLWNYCCKDACSTFELRSHLHELIHHLNLSTQWDIQMYQWHMILEMMIRGVKMDLVKRREVTGKLINTLNGYESRLDKMVPESVLPRKKKAAPWYRSPKQIGELFYDVLGIPPDSTKKVDDEHLERIKRIQPVFNRLTISLQEFRSLSLFLKTFCLAKISSDDRMRCTYNPTASTFRWKSSKNAFNEGGNLQNIPRVKED